MLLIPGEGVHYLKVSRIWRLRKPLLLIPSCDLCADAISEYPAREDFTDTAFVGSRNLVLIWHDGLMACFPLKHSAGAPTGSIRFHWRR